MQINPIFGIIVLIFSVILHEVSHGYMADFLGDPTARRAGRLTLNPLPHIDLVGSILLPLFLILTGSPILFGYAKPVPYNPYNLSGRRDETLVAFAGPGTNLVIALLFGLLIRFAAVAMTGPMILAFGTIVYINMLLGLFNLIPIPPLDGSKVLSGLLPSKLAHGYDLFRSNFERLGLLPLILILLVIFYFISPVFISIISWLFQGLTGVAF